MNFLDGLRREIVAWSKAEGPRWIFAFKTTVAVLLALAVSMRLELGQPVTAMVTVYIVMHPQTGMVLTKSLYRVCGTLAGTLASLALLGLFAQERVLFLVGLALWVGLCAAGAAVYRNFKSYGFTLAGYTAAMIGLPLVMQPTGFFNYAVNRATEVVVGIICAGVVSEVVFPRSLGDGIIKTMEERYARFMGFVTGLLSKSMTPREIDRMHLHVASNVVALESLRSSLFMEASDIRSRDLRLRRLNMDFMEMSTTFHSLCQILSRLTDPDAPAAPALASLGALLAEALAPECEPASGAECARLTARRLAEFRVDLPERESAILRECLDHAGHEARLDIETALDLVRRFVHEIHHYMRTYASLMEKAGPEKLNEVSFASRTDLLVALVTGVRTATAILLVSAFWIASAWPYGASAVMMAAIGTALFAPAPDPTLAIKTALVGTLIGFGAALACKFFILTSLNGIGFLVMGMAPFLLVGSYLALNPKLAMVGLGYSTMFCFMVSPANRMLYDPIISINFGTALILGVAAAALIFATFAPVTGGWMKRRTARMLRGQVEMACSCTLPHLGSRYESGTRDLLQRVAAKPNLQDVHDREIVGWTFVALEIGRAVIHLRQDAASVLLPQRVSAGAINTPRQIARFFGRPNQHNHNAALVTVEETIDAILSASAGEGVGEETVDAMRRMLTSLHLIRSSLLDEESILAATTSRPRGIIPGETSYAT
ncbi:FUSC family protein [Geomonas azotofigens]|uniref:FUSC family protein n=1 Tax=Geomonas azotofigens TaxID=2843196 RepID=UPI001C120266|nr:FUSC family protein [Geomonas azotofigens]MBU5613910.1 FUSC family protein [Geomonas azotofigens]